MIGSWVTSMQSNGRHSAHVERERQRAERLGPSVEALKLAIHSRQLLEG